jgi:NTE family protein
MTMQPLSRRHGVGKSLVRSLLCVGIMLSAGCASFTVADTQPLPANKLEPPGSLNISRDGYRLDLSSTTTNDAPDLLVLVAMSGGGKRSASFGYGALQGMRETMVQTPAGPRSLLSQVSGMSGVSGGSFPAAYYGLYRDEAFGKFEQDFLYDDTDAYIWGIYLLPWNWTWLVDPTVGTNDFMDRVYDRTMFHGAKYSALQTRGRPFVAIGATDISYGSTFLFTQEYFDLICSNLDDFPISRAVAASNGFPGLFSPVTLTDHAADCGGRKPRWLTAIPPQQLQMPLSRAAQQAQMADRYLDPRQTRYLHLVDGGVADNLALRAAGSLQEVATIEAIRARGFDKLRRLLVLSIDGEGSQDTSLARQKITGGLLSLLLQASGGQIDRYNFETLIVVGQQLQGFATLIAKARCEEGPLIDGAPCGDVKAALLHISLANTPPGPEKDKLLAIPTGLTIPHDDVDLLVKAGHNAITNSAQLRAFLEHYPAEQVAPAKTPPRQRVVTRDGAFPRVP